MLSEFSYLEEIGHEKGDLIKGLQLIQQREGYVSDDAVRAVAENFGMSPAEVEGVLTFYAQFKRVKPGRFQISSCDGTACHVKGSTTILDALYEKLNIKPDRDSTDDMMFTVETVSCLGACGLAPVMVINDEVHGQVKPSDIPKIIDELLARQAKESNEVA